MCFFRKKVQTMRIKFGVPFFDVYDTKFSEFYVPISIRGEVSFQIKNLKKFLKTNGYETLNVEEFQNQVRGAFIRYAKQSLLETIEKEKIPVVHIEKKLGDIIEQMQEGLSKRAKQEWKTSLAFVDITIIEIDKQSNGYLRLKSITQDITVKMVQTEANVRVQAIEEKGRVDMQDYAETVKYEREQEQKGVQKRIKRLAVACGILGILLVAVIILLVKTLQ